MISSAHWDDFLSLSPFRVTLELSCSETKLFVSSYTHILNQPTHGPNLPFLFHHQPVIKVWSEEQALVPQQRWHGSVDHLFMKLTCPLALPAGSCMHHSHLLMNCCLAHWIYESVGRTAHNWSLDVLWSCASSLPWCRNTPGTALWMVYAFL